MLIILISTFLISYFIISNFKGTKNSFFNLSFIVTTPPLIGLIYYEIISRFDIPIGQKKFIDPIFNEISLKYCFSILSLVLILSLIKYFNPSLLRVKIKICQYKTSFFTYIVFYFLNLLPNYLIFQFILKILFLKYLIFP